MNLRSVSVYYSYTHPNSCHEEFVHNTQEHCISYDNSDQAVVCDHY